MTSNWLTMIQNPLAEITTIAYDSLDGESKKTLANCVTISHTYDASMTRAFEAEGRRIGNVQELRHGTKAFNLLSILKSGYPIPPTNAGYVTGRLFGNVIYFSDQSTKS